MNGSNYFKERILRKHKEDMAMILTNLGKERQRRTYTKMFEINR